MKPFNRFEIPMPQREPSRLELFVVFLGFVPAIIGLATIVANL